MREQQSLNVRISATFHKLCIQKNLEFECHILWRRNAARAVTKPVTHKNHFSVFQETLHLDFVMIRNVKTAQFRQKNCEISVFVDYQGNVKSGGTTKFDLGEILNSENGQLEKELKLTQCPDPNAYLLVTFNSEVLGKKTGQIDESVLLETSTHINQPRSTENENCANGFTKHKKEEAEQENILNILAKGKSKAQKSNSDQEPCKAKSQVEKMNKLLNKMEVKIKQLPSLAENLKESVQETEPEESKHEQNELRQRLLRKEEESQKEKKALLAKIVSLENELKSRDRKENNISEYEQLYDNALEEIKELKKAKDSFKESQSNAKHNKVADLEQQRDQLEDQVTKLTFNMARLFNASQKYGGTKLVDYLQTSIGIVE